VNRRDYGDRFEDLIKNKEGRARKKEVREVFNQLKISRGGLRKEIAFLSDARRNTAHPSMTNFTTEKFQELIDWKVATLHKDDQERCRKLLNSMLKSKVVDERIKRESTPAAQFSGNQSESTEWERQQ